MPGAPLSRAFVGAEARVLAWLGDRFNAAACRLVPIRFEATGLGAGVFASGPVILVANHCSIVDTAAIRHALPPQVRARTATVGAQDLFTPPQDAGMARAVLTRAAAACVVRAYSVCLVGRGEDTGDGVPRIRALLEAGWNVAIFAEGTRSRTGELGRLRAGAAHLSRQTGAPVLPVWIAGSAGVLPVGARRLQGGSVRVHAGAPMRVADGETAHAFMERVRDALLALRGQAHSRAAAGAHG